MGMWMCVWGGIEVGSRQVYMDSSWPGHRTEGSGQILRYDLWGKPYKASRPLFYYPITGMNTKTLCHVLPRVARITNPAFLKYGGGRPGVQIHFKYFMTQFNPARGREQGS